MLPHIHDEEKARQDYFTWQQWGWANMQTAQPYAYWLIEIKKSISDFDEEPLIMHPISNNCICDYWNREYFDSHDYFWRPLVFGYEENNKK